MLAQVIDDHRCHSRMLSGEMSILHHGLRMQNKYCSFERQWIEWKHVQHFEQGRGSTVRGLTVELTCLHRGSTEKVVMVLELPSALCSLIGFADILLQVMSLHHVTSHHIF